MAFPSASMHRLVGAVLLVFLGNVVGSGTSFAQERTDQGQQRSVTVKYADLNLSSVEGSRLLYKRLVQAAERVCPDKSATAPELRANREADKCIADAVERAVQQIKSPRFAEVAAAQRR